MNNSFEEELAAISKKLDEIEMGIAMSQEALESIEINMILFQTELDFKSEGS
jgi:hypothetical protein